MLPGRCNCSGTCGCGIGCRGSGAWAGAAMQTSAILKAVIKTFFNASVNIDRNNKLTSANKIEGKDYRIFEKIDDQSSGPDKAY